MTPTLEAVGLTVLPTAQPLPGGLEGADLPSLVLILNYPSRKSRYELRVLPIFFPLGQPVTKLSSFLTFGISPVPTALPKGYTVITFFLKNITKSSRSISLPPVLPLPKRSSGQLFYA